MSKKLTVEKINALLEDATVKKILENLSSPIYRACTAPIYREVRRGDEKLLLALRKYTEPEPRPSTDTSSESSFKSGITVGVYRLIESVDFEEEKP